MYMYIHMYKMYTCTCRRAFRLLILSHLLVTIAILRCFNQHESTVKQKYMQYMYDSNVYVHVHVWQTPLPMILTTDYSKVANTAEYGRGFDYWGEPERAPHLRVAWALCMYIYIFCFYYLYVIL